MFSLCKYVIISVNSWSYSEFNLQPSLLTTANYPSKPPPHHRHQKTLKRMHCRVAVCIRPNQALAHTLDLWPLIFYDSSRFIFPLCNLYQRHSAPLPSFCFMDERKIAWLMFSSTIVPTCHYIIYTVFCSNSLYSVSVGVCCICKSRQRNKVWCGLIFSHYVRLPLQTTRKYMKVYTSGLPLRHLL